MAEREAELQSRIDTEVVGQALRLEQRNEAAKVCEVEYRAAARQHEVDLKARHDADVAEYKTREVAAREQEVAARERKAELVAKLKSQISKLETKLDTCEAERGRLAVELAAK
jgi:hypothetical protein